MAKKKVNPSVEEVQVTMSEEVVTPVEVETPVVITGTVVKCERLNVRKEANKTGKVIKVLNKGDKPTIDEAKSTKDWYFVKTESGVKGFCMKEYININ